MEREELSLDAKRIRKRGMALCFIGAFILSGSPAQSQSPFFHWGESCLKELTFEKRLKVESSLTQSIEECLKSKNPVIYSIVKNVLLEVVPIVNCSYVKEGMRVDGITSGYRSSSLSLNLYTRMPLHSILFHELLHVSGVDNQRVEEHNERFLDMRIKAQTDVIYACQKLCGEPNSFDNTWGSCRLCMKSDQYDFRALRKEDRSSFGELPYRETDELSRTVCSRYPVFM